MTHQAWNKATFLTLAGVAVLAGCVTAPPPPPPPPARAVEAPSRHPAYLHALSNLRAARWLIEHRPPGDAAQSQEEQEAVRQIDAALSEIRKAAIDDGKNLNDHPPADEHADHRGRLHQVLDLLRNARAEISREEDNDFANGLRDRAIGHIDQAIRAAHQMFND
jgi:hypothetical protein